MGFDLGSNCGRSGADLGSIWGRYGIDLAYPNNDFERYSNDETILGLLRSGATNYGFLIACSSDTTSSDTAFSDTTSTVSLLQYKPKAHTYRKRLRGS